MSQAAKRELTLAVQRHPSLKPDDLLIGTLKIKGVLTVGRDLQPGDELLVIVQDTDGEVLASSKAEAESPAFKTVKDKGAPIGTERVHTAELTE